MICRLETPNLQCLMLILLSSFWLFRVYDLQNISNASILTTPSLTRSYCWIHGTAYVRPQLQGKATGCFVDQSKLESEEVGRKIFSLWTEKYICTYDQDAPITAYYLWLPYLLSLLFVLAKLPHSAWKRFFENNLIAHILGGSSPNSMDQTQHNWSAFGGEKIFYKTQKYFAYLLLMYELNHFFCRSAWTNASRYGPETTEDEVGTIRDRAELHRVPQTREVWSLPQEVRILGGIQPGDRVRLHVRHPLDPQLQVYELRNGGQ